MTRTVLSSAVVLSLALSAGAHAAPAIIGQPAPDFTLTDVDGKTVHLADFKGRHVVLEWNNPACPFVKKHYETQNMQSLQRKYDKDVVWLTVNSAHPGNGAYLDNAALKSYVSAQKASPAAYLPDPQGKAGLAYGALATPAMYVINPAGTLVYAGAIDDKPSTDKADVKTARNYVVAALDESRAGKHVSVAKTTAYGCHIAYN